MSNDTQNTVEMLQSMIADINSGRIEPGDLALKKHGPESVSMTLYYRTIPQETPEQKAERLEAELVAVKESRDRLIHAGQGAANICWNFGRNSGLEMTERHRELARQAAAEWVNAIANRSNTK